ncbi:hypothetical protein MRB53_031653 [Persea americana]|uniref:Uncharacterized protein n=1 Tax=Persea americana TaxID=3435 RepID=A0ACC2KPL6_PERAE|nr:hypothetical protein MRB53_031653 [Persea americana]|eukprot:TRINITY_DN17240_c2_g2_i1.p1 TRINITY_DN17240_c2_g2~~TRINITY_DN17240_c2_g2_i1.p1  ORF type:complete len:371 (+),score=74.44 TRINITY_DN17240_c2_g2_i1:155-1267(+)
MEVLQVLHMNGGNNQTSYASNSSLQRKAISIAKPITEEAILASFCKTAPESLGVADLGCSSGPNTLFVVSKIIEAIYAKCSQLSCRLPEFRIFLNDLPGNDFNTIFTSLPAFYDKLKEEKGDDLESCFIAGVPGSFYGRLFPSKSLHFVHSSYSLMWLSQVPPELDSEIGSITNKGNIYMAKTSPPEVLRAYLKQFQKDFFKFLRSRSEEIVPGGRMVLQLLGRTSADPSSKECCYIWELLAQALNDMVLQGVIEESKLDSFNLPQYAPSPPEVKALVQAEGSFIVHRLETYAVSWDPEDNAIQNLVFDRSKRAEKVATYMRAVAEPLVSSHFGEAIVHDLFKRYRDIVSEHMETEDAKFTNLVISLERK